MTNVNIIAELCQNHNGSINNVEKMINVAAENGATHVKIQNIYADMVTLRPQFENGVEKNGKMLSIKRPYKDEYDRLKGLELSFKDCEKFVNLCHQANVIPLTTCFSHGTVDEIKNMGFDEIKIASYDCGSFPLIERLCSKFNTLHISTGATYDSEIEMAVKIMKKHNKHFFIYHCVTIYPTPLEEMHLSRLNYLKDITGMNNVGLSEHSLYNRDGVIASMAAIALGASSIERHFTIAGPEETKDGPVSIDANGLKKLAEFKSKSKNDQFEELSDIMPNWESVMYGQIDRKLSESELLNRDYFKGRFGTPRHGYGPQNMIFNWEIYND